MLFRSLALYGLPDSYFETFVPRIRAVTADDVTRVAQEYVHPEKMTVVVVGDRDAVESPPYQRSDSGWNVDRLLPSLTEMRPATSTGSRDPSTYSHVSSASVGTRRRVRRERTGRLIEVPPIFSTVCIVSLRPILQAVDGPGAGWRSCGRQPW